MNAPAPPPTPVACPNCGAGVMPGRFCSACGKEMDLHATTAGALGDALGVKRVALMPYLRTAWFAVTHPAELSRRWIGGARAGLVSPVAMMGAVTFATAIVAFILTRWTGARIATYPININDMMALAPFLKDRFPEAVTAAALNRDSLNSQFQQVGGWFAGFGPSLLILPGWLSLAPWRRIDRRSALIFAFVESVFLLILTGINTSITLASSELAESTLVKLAFPIAVIAHGAIHVRGLTGSGWGYAVTRPLLAMLLFAPIVYLWVVFVLTLTLALWT